MRNRCNDKLLRVNLANGQMAVEEPGEDFYRTYLGGWGWIAHFLLREVAPGAAPLGPGNRLIFALGTLTGVPVPGSGRSAVGGKSPLTGVFGEADVGGFWGAELKHAGYDAVIFEGRADRPVYLWVHDGAAELRPADHLWGRTTGETQAQLRAELGDDRLRTAAIGPAGENLVLYACVMNDLKHAAGRCGLGAVMGSKNLKAIAARGHRVPDVADPEGIRELSRWLGEHYRDRCASLVEYGTGAGMVGSSESGGLPTHNFRDGVFSGVENISAEAVKRDLNGRMEGCYTCPIRCKKVVEAEAPYRIDPQYGGPEYEALGALGSCCGVSDLPAVAKANELCNAYSLDVISTGVSIAFLMECYEEGLIGPADTDGLDLRFGHGEALVEMVERIARREGIGEFAAEGVKRMALHLGPKAEPWAVHIKGQEAPMHDPRARSPQLSLGYVLSPTGADHVHTTNWNILKNCLGLCEILPYDREQVATLVNAVTDWGLAPEDLDTVGERAMDLARVFNTREGLTAEDDRTAPRFATPFASGPRQGQFIDVEALEQAKQEYYEKMGWDPQRAVPTRARLETLGIGWAADWLASA